MCDMWSTKTRAATRGIMVVLLSLAGCSGTSPERLDAAAIEEDLRSISTVDLTTTADMILLPDHASPCGVCAAPTPLCDPGSGRCVACLADGDCGMGKLCVERQCIMRCLGDGD